MPTLTETEDRLRHTLHAVASSLHDSDQAPHSVARTVAGSVTPLARGRKGRSRRRSPLLVFAASFLAVLAVGAISMLSSGTQPGGDLDRLVEPGVSNPVEEATPDPVVSGLGMHGAYFALDDPSWTLTEAWATSEGEPGTYSMYQRGDERVVVLSGSAASHFLDSALEGRETNLTMNSNQVTERSSAQSFSFNWTTSDGMPVLVTFSGMDRDQALQVATTLRPIDSDAWEQLLLTAVVTASTTPGTELRARTGEFGTGGEEGSGEWIRLDAPDAPEVIFEMAEGIELPPGHTFDRVIQNLPEEPSEQTEDGIMSMLEFEAGCIWTGYWLDAVEAGDTAAQNRAQEVLDVIPTWPALNATDGGGVVDAWTRNAGLAAAGDVQGVLDNLYIANCTDIVPGQ